MTWRMTRRHWNASDARLGQLPLSTIPTSARSTRSANTVTSPGATLGTVAYMSPEQVRAKELDARTDLFSFGAVLYEIVTGQVPFRGESSGVIFNAILERLPVSPIRINPDIPPKLEDIITKCLEKDRNLRYQHASDIRTDLQRLKRDTESGKAVSTGTATPRWSHRTKLISAGVFVFLIAVIAVTAFYFGSSSGHAPINSVAVLPFSNASGDPNTEYLSDGITEGIIDRLSGLPTLKVISRTSAFHFKGREIEPKKVAQELATAVSTKLRGGLTTEEKTRLNKTSAINSEAYQLYLRGRYHASQSTASALKRSNDYFQQAIDKDPGYALPYAALADAY